MKAEQGILWLLNWLLSAFLAFAALTALERMLRLGPWYSAVRCCWPLLICFPAGLAVRRRRNRKLPLLCAAVLLAVAATGLLLGVGSILRALYLLAAAAAGGGMALLGLRGDAAFPRAAVIAALALLLGGGFVCYLTDASPQDELPLFRCGLIFFLLAMYSFNAGSLMAGVHNARGAESMELPVGVRGRNFALLTLFLAAALSIGNLDILHRLLGVCWRGLLLGVGAFLDLIARLQGGGDVGPAATPAGTARPADPQVIVMPNDGSGAFVAVYGILLGILAVAFALAAFGVLKQSRGHLARLPDWLRRLLQTRETELYEDEVEKTLDTAALLREQGQRLRRAFRRLTARPQRFSEMPDDRMRVRFAYWTLLKSGRISGWTSAATPREVGSALSTPALRELTERYNEIRYDPDAPVPPGAGAAAEAAMRTLRRGSKE